MLAHLLPSTLVPLDVGHEKIVKGWCCDNRLVVLLFARQVSWHRLRKAGTC